MNISETAIDIILQELILPRMKELGITPYKLAKMTNIGASSVGRFLKGKQDISLHKFFDILYSLGINPQFELKDIESWDGTNWDRVHDDWK